MLFAAPHETCYLAVLNFRFRFSHFGPSCLQLLIRFAHRCAHSLGFAAMPQNNRTPKRGRQGVHASYSHGVQVANNISNLAMAAIAAGQQANNNLAASMQVASAQAAQSSQSLLAMSLASVQASVLHHVQLPISPDSADEEYDPDTARSLGLKTLPPRPRNLHVGEEVDRRGDDGRSIDRPRGDTGRSIDHCGDDGRSIDHCGEDRRIRRFRSMAFGDNPMNHRPNTPPRKADRQPSKTPPRKDDRQPTPRRAAIPNTPRCQSPGGTHRANCQEELHAARSSAPPRQSLGELEDTSEYYSEEERVVPAETPEEVRPVTADRYGGRSSSSSSSRTIVINSKKGKNNKDKKEKKHHETQAKKGTRN